MQKKIIGVRKLLLKALHRFGVAEQKGDKRNQQNYDIGNRPVKQDLSFRSVFFITGSFFVKMLYKNYNRYSGKMEPINPFHFHTKRGQNRILGGFFKRFSLKIRFDTQKSDFVSDSCCICVDNDVQRLRRHPFQRRVLNPLAISI